MVDYEERRTTGRRTIEDDLTTPTTGESMSPGMGGTRGGGGENKRRLSSAWREGSPDEVRDEVRRLVEKGVAAVSGAITGFTERAKRDRLPEKSGEAIQKAGETAQSVVEKTGEQAKSMRGSLKETTHEVGQTTRDVGTTATEEARKTTEEVGQKGSEAAATASEQARRMKESTKGGGSGGSQQ